MGPNERVIFRFGDFEYDLAAYELRRKGQRVSLARQPMDLLLLLLQRSGGLVSREEIARHLWRDTAFTDFEAGIRTAVLKVRQALGDTAESPTYVQTVAGKGYRFVASVNASSGRSSDPVGGTAFGVYSPTRHNLPAELTRFIGRAEVLIALRELLRASRLLSLTGAGGVGKTRLAVRLAADVARDYPNGVWFADFGALSTPDLIGSAVAAVVGVREGSHRPIQEALVDYVRERKLLLIFDTCEHLIDGCAELAERLLRASPASQILATSREPLAAPGEAVYRVPALSVPNLPLVSGPASLTDFEATELFVERARAAQAAFNPDGEAATSIVNICRRLDGIPLAIELAAAQSASLTPAQIDARLADGSAPGHRRTVVARQRTLDATIDWSYQLLSDRERQLFDRLSVFPESWIGEAAGRVCASDAENLQVEETLRRLVAKSLVQTIGASDPPRFHLLETIRQFAHERLADAGASDDLRDRHFDYVHGAFLGAWEALVGPDQVAWLRQLHVERDNIRDALAWGLSRPALRERAVELTAALFWYWTKRGLFAEGRQWLERAAAAPASTLLRARVSLGLGHMDYFQGRFADMAARNDEVLNRAREIGDDSLVRFALFGHALAAFERGAFAEAASLATEARTGAGREDFSSPALVLGNVALVSGDQDRALAHFDEAIHGLRRVGELWGLGIVLSLAAGLRGIRGDSGAARAHAEEALSIYRELEDARGIAWSVDVFAGLAAAEERADDAALLWGASDGLLESVAGALVPTVGWLRERYRDRVAARLGPDEFARLTAHGRAMPPAEAIALATDRVDAFRPRRDRSRRAARH